MKSIVMYLATVYLLLSCQSPSSNSENQASDAPKSKIAGAWEMVESVTADQDSSWTTTPYRSVAIFTDKYYSNVFAFSKRPSWPDLPDDEPVPEDILRTTYGGFVANTGTYDLQGDSLITTALVAKSPNYMNDFPRSAYGFSLDGDKLTVRAKFNSGLERTTTYRRVE